MSLYDALDLEHGASLRRVKEAFHKIARDCHPDRTNDVREHEMFRRASAAYEVLGDPRKKTEYDKTGKEGDVVIPTKRSQYRLCRLPFHGDIADIYTASDSLTYDRVCVKIVRDERNNDLFDNEVRALKAIRPPELAEEPRLSYFPHLIDTAVIDDGKSRRKMHVFPYYENYYALRQVKLIFGPDLRFEHVVWMFNRMLEALYYVHERGYVHGAVNMHHVMVYSSTNEPHRLDHGAKLVGWGQATKIGEKLKIVVEPRYHYPDLEISGGPVSPSTDLFMAASCALGLLPPGAPKYLTSFFQGCLLADPKARPQSAWDLHQEFKEHMAKHYGPKKYFPFNVLDKELTNGRK